VECGLQQLLKSLLGSSVLRHAACTPTLPKYTCTGPHDQHIGKVFHQCTALCCCNMPCDGAPLNPASSQHELTLTMVLHSYHCCSTRSWLLLQLLTSTPHCLCRLQPHHQGHAHHWTNCPYAHVGEHACRRDPRKFDYAAVVCPDLLQGGHCPQGETCHSAHSVSNMLHMHTSIW
jgi:hypothetical protein